jgi:hypothetical protein
MTTKKEPLTLNDLKRKLREESNETLNEHDKLGEEDRHMKAWHRGYSSGLLTAFRYICELEDVWEKGKVES